MPHEEMSKRVRAARAYAGLTQEDMASRLDMSPVTYKRIEQSKRPVSIPEIARIAEITGWPTEMFHLDIAQVAGVAADEQKEELTQLRSTIGGLVARLEDIEYRIRKDVTEAADSIAAVKTP
jgi:transcriptional regulator with XRE-family HTH domain